MAAVGHIAFHCDVTSICAYLRMSCFNQGLTNIQIYIDIYVRVSIGGNNMGTFYARKLKFGMVLSQT